MRRDEVRTLDDLRALLERFPDDKEGNRALAVHLWGYQLWTRAEQLRGLVRFLVSRDIGTLDGCEPGPRGAGSRTSRGRCEGSARRSTSGS
jgi:hypothetical protein